MTPLRRISPDALAVIALVLLCALFFWRILTPIDADKASFKEGDFSAQFSAFGAYHYDRFRVFEVPLWNPYNNSGLPFVADTQAAAIYPPRMFSMGLLTWPWWDQWYYRVLEYEAIVHVLVYTLAMHAFVHRMTGSVWGGFTAAVVGGYGGYMSGYPPLQLAVLEAGAWLPLVLMGIYEGTKNGRVRYIPLVLTAISLGCSWLAGHPQTSWFLTYLAMAYFAYCVWDMPDRLWTWIKGVAFFGVLTVAACAVALFPGVEYLAHTARADMGYATKGNGFPFQDVLQMLYPGTVSLFSPLYVGIPGLILALTALRLPRRQVAFWFGVVIFGLLLSFGANAALFPSLYNTVPGLRFFRGQERAAYLVAHSLAILSGIGMAGLIRGEIHRGGLLFRRLLLGAMLFTGGMFVLVTLLWFGFREQYGSVIGPVTFAFFVAVAAYAVGVRLLDNSNAPNVANSNANTSKVANSLVAAFVIVLVFDLFSVNMDADSNYDDIRPQDQLAIEPPPLITPVLPEDEVFRVDGFRGLTGNFGSLYNVYDARGISPLFLDGPFQLQQEPFASAANFETNPTFWELNAVRYVYSGFEELPVESEIITTGDDMFGPVMLHELADPRPFALPLYQADVVDSDEFARALLADERYTPRESVILHTEPTLDLPENGDGDATVTEFLPERIVIEVTTDENAILSLAHPHYPGWQATLGGERVDLLRAYGGFSAVEVPAGTHTLELVYRPLTFAVGALITFVTWVGFALIGLREIVRGSRNATHRTDKPVS
ncbi:MAG: YfhO family protein [Chloroflexota bacterium]